MRLASTRSVIALGVGLLMATLTVLAYASPPDPVWMSGIYDEADHDDVIALIVSGVALVDAMAVDQAPAPVITYAIRLAQQVTRPPLFPSHPVRAPPAS